MSLGRKIAVLFLVLGISFCAGSYAALKLSVYPAFEAIEQEYAANAVARVRRALDAELRAIEIMNIEYSSWNDTYEYVHGRQPRFAEDHLNPENWQSVDIDLMLIFDRAGRQIYGRITHPLSGRDLSPDEIFGDGIAPGGTLVSHASETSSIRGLVRTPAGPMHVASYPVLHGDRSGPVAGSLIVGRLLVGHRVTAIGERATATVALHDPTSAHSAPAGAARAGAIGHPVTFQTSRDYILARQTLPDIHGQPAAIAEVVMPRRITAIAADTARTMMLAVMAASAAFMLAALVFMRRLIVAPLNELTARILDIRRTGRLEFRRSSRRRDEIGLLAGEFEGMTSRLREAHADLEQARDDALALSRTKSEFLARMSHEIRTPMNGVLGMTELLSNTALDAKQRRFAGNIYASAESLLAIINDILDFSKMEAGKFALDEVETPLRTVIEETVESLAGQAQVKGLELAAILPTDLHACVHTDPVRLRQVLTNLIGNAIKFTEQGEVVVRVSTMEPDPANLQVTFEVTDTGIGIGQDKQEEIFESFTQEDGTTTRVYGGTGLGLAISRQLVELLGGELSVESIPGEGSTFAFSLLMSKAADIEEAPARPLRHIAGRHFLIVDDNATNREIFEHQLASWRAKSESASSAQQALELLDAAAAAGRPHELAILDMHMPHMDGLDLARAIRERPALDELRLVILSSMPDPASEEDLRTLDIAGQLTKPVRQGDLYNTLIAILGGERLPLVQARGHGSSIKHLTGRLLLAEDNPVNRIVALGMLESMGLTAEVAGNGREAVEKAHANEYDVILMDCQMPEMDGFEATRRIRRSEAAAGHPPTPIIAVTANALKGDREACQAAGMTDYLSKPFTTEHLHGALAQFLQTARMPAPAPVGVQEKPGAPAQAGEQDAATAPAPPVIDDSVLARLSQLRQANGPDLVHQVVGVYLSSAGPLRAQLCEAVEAADTALIRASAHALKSSSANVGASRLADLCRRLESDSRADDLSQAAALHQSIELEFEQVIEALRDRVA